MSSAKRPTGRSVGVMALVGLVVLAGCGVISASRTNYATTLTSTDGSPIHVEDVREIVDDNLLTDDEKRGALVDLGIEDDDLIDALLTLP